METRLGLAGGAGAAGPTVDETQPSLSGCTPDLEKAPVGPGCQLFLLPMDRSAGGMGGAYSRRVFS